MDINYKNKPFHLLFIIYYFFNLTLTSLLYSEREPISQLLITDVEIYFLLSQSIFGIVHFPIYTK